MKMHQLMKNIEDDLDIYDQDAVELFEEDDSISAAEAGFMIGYLSA